VFNVKTTEPLGLTIPSSAVRTTSFNDAILDFGLSILDWRTPEALPIIQNPKSKIAAILDASTHLGYRSRRRDRARAGPDPRRWPWSVCGSRLSSNASITEMEGTVRGKHLIGGVLISMMAGLILAGAASALEVGQKAPDFTLPAPGNRQVKLADLLGKGPVVIYTFIQAFTAT